MKLSVGQRQAVIVLAGAYWIGSGPVDGWKRSSATLPRPRVNYIAAGSLVGMGIARRVYRDPLLPRSSVANYVHEERYELTEKGLGVAAEIAAE